MAVIFIFLFASQGIKRRKRERMVFDKNTQVCKVICLYNHVGRQGGSVAEWSARRTRNPAVPGSSPALAT